MILSHCALVPKEARLERMVKRLREEKGFAMVT